MSKINISECMNYLFMKYWYMLLSIQCLKITCLNSRLVAKIQLSVKFQSSSLEICCRYKEKKSRLAKTMVSLLILLLFCLQSKECKLNWRVTLRSRAMCLQWGINQAARDLNQVRNQSKKDQNSRTLLSTETCPEIYGSMISSKKRKCS